MRHRTAIAAGFMICLAVGDYVACRVLQTRMQHAYDGWVDTMQRQGWTVHTGRVTSQLTPLGASLVLGDVSVDGGRAVLPGGLSWHAERLVVSISLAHPRRLQIAPEAEQQLRLAASPPLVMSSDSLVASVPLGAGRPDQIDVRAEGLVLGEPRYGERQVLRLDHAEWHLRAEPGSGSRTATGLIFTARGIGLPDNGRWALGAAIGKLHLDVALTSPVLSGAAPAEQARAWRDWGGALLVRQLDVHWGPLDMLAQGSVNLDQDLQPEGSGTARISGGRAALTALAQGGTIPDGVAQTGQMVLSLMAKPAGNGDTLDLPLKLKNSTVSVGKLPVMSVRTVDWGRA